MDFLPMPKKVTDGEGRFAIRHSTPVILVDTPPEALLFAQMLIGTIQTETGLSLSILRGVPRRGEIVLTVDGSLSAQQYVLDVQAEGITLRGGSKEGLCYGVQTLRQWVQRHGARLPALTVEDEPDLENRGYYLDVSRGRVPTLAVLKQYADLLCQYKINQWQLYVEHTYLFRDFSEAWRDETPLTAQEIMELDAYCNARCIELVPSLSTFGHMCKILSTKTYAEYCELSDSEKQPFFYSRLFHHYTLNVAHPGTLDLVKGMITEYMQLFTSRKFNICADETFDLGKERSKHLAESLGEHTIYINHVKVLCNWLIEQNRTPMFWGDIIWRHPEVYELLPKETICLNWGYSPTQSDEEIRALAKVNATQYACPGVCTWNCWLPMLRDSYDNISLMCKYAHQYGAIGLLNTDWGDYAHVCHPWFSVPGILYGANFAWNAAGISFEEINKAISFLAYGDASGRFMQSFVALTANEVFAWRNAVNWIDATDAAARKAAFADIDATAVPEANTAIMAAMDALHEAAREVAVDKRGILHALDIAAEGITLWNEIAQYVARTFEGQDIPARDGAALAGALETWYLAYTAQRRAVSKEGGIAPLTQLIANFADRLRGREYIR